MEFLDRPAAQLWEARRAWFECQAEPPDQAGCLLSEQACALCADLQIAFCTGAWIAVIVVSAAAIDAHLREAEGFEGSAKNAIDLFGSDPKLHALRKRRNTLIHANVDSPAITVDAQWHDRPTLEAEAQEAVMLVFKVFYANPCV